MKKNDYFIDVSSYQSADLTAICQAAGTRKTIIKVSEGTGYLSPARFTQASTSEPVGYYHFARFGGNVSQAVAEANYFLANLPTKQLTLSVTTRIALARQNKPIQTLFWHLWINAHKLVISRYTTAISLIHWLMFTMNKLLLSIQTAYGLQPIQITTSHQTQSGVSSQHLMVFAGGNLHQLVLLVGLIRTWSCWIATTQQVRKHHQRLK